MTKPLWQLELEIRQSRKFLDCFRKEVDSAADSWRNLQDKYYTLAKILEDMERQYMQLHDEEQIARDEYFVNEHNRGEWA